MSYVDILEKSQKVTVALHILNAYLLHFNFIFLPNKDTSGQLFPISENARP